MPTEARRTKLVEQLRELWLDRIAIDEEITRVVELAREADTSWERIGEALGVTKQAAQQRYG